MDIGGALAEARSEAGLTVTEVSERTRIRATIIRDIERDDYATCGGDFYARGHIRAIARVVGADPVPLIEEYDAARMPAPDLPRADPDADTNPDLFDASEQEFLLPGRLWPRLRQSAADWTAAVASRLAGDAGGRDRTGGTGGGGAGGRGAASDRPAGLSGITAAEAFRPGMPLELGRRRSPRSGLVALVVLAVVGVLIYLLVSGGLSHGTAPPTPQSHPSGAAAYHSAGTAAATPVSGPLRIAGAAAFGPGGTGHGDDPAAAPLAIDGSASTGWHTDWYTTARFGGLQPGTGLLLSLGRSATITSARIMLGTAPGGTIELRAGDTPSLADLPVVARAANTGGALTMSLSSPVRARYVLIWFTSLPPGSSGTYQASIYDVSLAGTTSA